MHLHVHVLCACALCYVLRAPVCLVLGERHESRVQQLEEALQIIALNLHHARLERVVANARVGLVGRLAEGGAERVAVRLRADERREVGGEREGEGEAR